MTIEHNTITVSFSGFFFVAIFLFVVGFLGVATKRRNMLAILLSLELLLLSSFLLFLFAAFYLTQPVGYVYAILVLSMAGAESAIGLGLLVVYYKLRSTIDVESLSLLRG